MGFVVLLLSLDDVDVSSLFGKVRHFFGFLWWLGGFRCFLVKVILSFWREKYATTQPSLVVFVFAIDNFLALEQLLLFGKASGSSKVTLLGEFGLFYELLD